MKIVICALILFCSRALANNNNLFRTVGSLVSGVNPSTVVYYDFEENPLLSPLLRRSEVPYIVVREETDSAFVNRINSEILSIVFIKDRYDTSPINTLRKTMHQLHKSDIVFLAPLLKGEEMNWKWIFQWCWSKGFYNVLLVSSNPHFKRLLTFNTFPVIKIRKTTVKEYLELYRNKWENFQGYSIRAGIYHDPPYTVLYEHNTELETEYVTPGGDDFQLMKLFAERHNATLIITVLSNSIDECLELLNSHKLDICLIGATYRPEKYVTIISPEMFPFHLLVPHAQPLNKYEYFLLPFDKGIWFAVLMTVGLIGVAITLLHLHYKRTMDMGLSLLAAFEMILYSGVRISGGGPRRFFILLIALISGFVITNLYLAHLSSFLSTKVYEKQIESFEDLRASNVTVLYPPLWSELTDVVNVFQALKDQIRKVDQDFFTAHMLDLNSSYAYICPIHVCDFILQQQFLMSVPRLRLVTKKVMEVDGGYAVRFDWPFEELFRQFFLNLFSFGITDGIEKQTVQEAIERGFLKLHRDVEDDVKPMTMEDIQVLLIILAIGYSAALITLCLENLIFYLTRIMSSYHGRDKP